MALLWVDKHRPTALDRMDYNAHISERLTRVAAAGDVPHLLFYGPAGSGKKVRIMALLRAVFGSGVEKLRLEHRNFTSASGREIELTTVASNFHIELQPSDAGIYDKDVVQQVIKEMAENASYSSLGKYKILILTDADSLSSAAQAALRRTMEKYSGTCRIILSCRCPSRIIAPLRSRCLGVRVAAPTNADVLNVLKTIRDREHVSVDEAFLQRVVAASRRNLRRALLIFEATMVQTRAGAPVVFTFDWEDHIKSIATDIVQEQSPKRLLIVRSKLYDALVSCIPPDVILKELMSQLVNKLDDELKHKLVALGAKHDHRLQLGQKPLIHLEAFIAEFMAHYKEFLVTVMG